ncbi:DNA annealing helicase and endonuclease ZRANB3-like isoform X2 [Acanthaster planci]|nr:DNA annealing helicase and endonuclease ZRANB3-like isoform X2 [Acanthaster planci]
MGLGKTIQAISVAYYYKAEWPLLIVVPSSMRYPWIEELERWLPDLQPRDMNLIMSGSDVRNIARCKVSLVGYGLLRNDSKTLVQALTDQAFRVVIVDESHYMKNRKAARTKVLVPLLQAAKRVMLLTGTPALARPAELFTQIDSVQKGLMGSFSQFAKRYCNAHWRQLGRQRMWDTSGASNLDELHKQLVKSVMIRREKKQVLTQLPPKRRQKVPFELADSDEKKELEKCWTELDKIINPASDPMEEIHNTGFEVKKLATQMYTLTGKAKIGAVCEYVKMLLENQGLKFLVFAHHKEVLTALAQTVAAYAKEHKMPLKYIRIDGDVPSSERMQLVHQFQNDSNTRVALLSILAAGTGLTLTAASQVVFAELHWTPGILEQCEDRAHRIGQQNAIHVHYLVARGTIDEWLWSALSRKVNVLSNTLNGRVQHLRMEEKGGDEVAFLKHAAAWLPSNRDLQDDESFYFASKKTSHDIRTFFTPGHTESTKKRKRDHLSSSRPAETPPNPHRVESISIDEDDDDFRGIKKHRPSSDLSPKELFAADAQLSNKTFCMMPGPGKFEKSTTVDKSTATGKDSGLAHFVDDLPEMRSNKKRRGNQRGKTELAVVEFEKNRLSDSDTEMDDQTTSSRNSNQSSREQCMPSSFEDKEKQNTVKELDANDSWSCCACTFENHADLPFCEICSTPRKTTRCRSSKSARRNLCTERASGQCGSIKKERASQSKNYSPTTRRHTTLDMLNQESSSIRLTDLDKSAVCNSVTKSPSLVENTSHALDGDTDSDNSVSSDSEATVFYDFHREPDCISSDTRGEQSSKKESTVKCFKPKEEAVGDCNLAEELKSSSSDTAVGSESSTTRENWTCDDRYCRHINSAYDDQCEVCYKTRPASKPSRKDVCLDAESSAAEENWTCDDPFCGYLNSASDDQCEACWSPRPKELSDARSVSNTQLPGFIRASQMNLVQSPGNKDDASVPEPEQGWPYNNRDEGDTGTDSSQTEPEEEPVLYDSFLYCPSKHTDRIYLYDQDGNALNCSFQAIDLQHRDLDALPKILHSQHNMHISLRFLKEWNSLNDVKRKQLRKMGELFDRPLAALEALKQGQHYQPCTKRFITKVDLAEAARQKAQSLGGSLRVISRPATKTAKRRAHNRHGDQSLADGEKSHQGLKSSVEQEKRSWWSDDNGASVKRGTYIQAVDGEGRPLCVFCGNVTAPSTTAHQGAAWDMRYCSEKCKDEHSLRWKNTKYVRQQLLEAEHGICQICGLEAQQLCNIIKDAAKGERKELLQGSPLSKLSKQRLNDIIRNPSSGQFWHADHIVAVHQGGGLCSLDNYRTLCVLCHDEVTAKQNTKRRNRDRAAGIPDIRSFFNP